MVLLKNWNWLATPPGPTFPTLFEQWCGSLTSYKNLISESASSRSKGRHSPNWANQAVAFASKSFSFCLFTGYDVDPRTHGSSSGYHSDEASPTTQKNEPSPIHDFRMPGMLEGQESPILSRKPVQPSDVIITVYKKFNFSERCQQAKKSSLNLDFITKWNILWFFACCKKSPVRICCSSSITVFKLIS